MILNKNLSSKFPLDRTEKNVYIVTNLAQWFAQNQEANLIFKKIPIKKEVIQAPLKQRVVTSMYGNPFV